MTAFVTQKIEFNSRDAYMRPGALMSVLHDDEIYTLLFLHLASMQDPRGFGLRQDMVDRALEFKTEVVDTVAALAGDQSNFIFLGDLNSMGLEYEFDQPGGAGTPISRDRVTADHEILRLSYMGRKAGMRLLTKTRDVTWRSDTLRSNLDHVVAADHLQFTQFSGADVAVRGWPELATEQEQRDWTQDFSDHALLYFEVQEV